ncbi:unnamed protein product [Scytosiphon promiscuus]
MLRTAACCSCWISSFFSALEVRNAEAKPACRVLIPRGAHVSRSLGQQASARTTGECDHQQPVCLLILKSAVTGLNSRSRVAHRDLCGAHRKGARAHLFLPPLAKVGGIIVVFRIFAI